MRKIILYTSLLISIIFLVTLLSYNASNNFKDFKTHQNYIRNNNTEIQDWMTPNTIIRHFNVSSTDIYNEFKIKNSDFNKPLSQICEEKKIDCKTAIWKLNTKK